MKKKKDIYVLYGRNNNSSSTLLSSFGGPNNQIDIRQINRIKYQHLKEADKG